MNSKSSVQVNPWPVALCIVCGIGGLALGGVHLWQSLRCKGWPQTDGIIRSAHVQKEPHRIYHAELSYDYKVGGVIYHGTRIMFGMYVGDEVYAKSVLERYPVGERVPVFYSATHPEESVLEPGVFGGTWEELSGSFGFFAASIVFVIFSRKFPEKSLKRS